MFKLFERLNELPIWGHVTDHQILLDDGSHAGMIEVQGYAWETRQPGEVQAMWDRLNQTMRNVMSPNLVLTVYQCRGVHDNSIYPIGSFRSEFSRRLDDAYKANILRRSTLYNNRTFICIQVRPDRPLGETVGNYLDARRSTPMEEPNEDRMDAVTQATRLLMTDLRRYRPRRLGTRVERGFVYSEIAEAIVLAMTGYYRKVPLTTGRLGEAMFSESMNIVHDHIHYVLPGRVHYGAAFGMKHFPTPTYPGMFAGLLASPYRSTTCQSYRFITNTEAQSIMLRKTYVRRTAEDPAVKQTAELAEAASSVGHDWVFGDYSFTHLVFAGTIDKLDDVAMEAWSIMADSGMVVARETTALEAALLSMCPGNTRMRPRPGYVSSRNFTAMAALHAYPTGDVEGKPHWGGPVCLFRTKGGVPYKFHLHVKDVGNIFVCGRTGSGKTVWLGFVISQAERLGATCVLFDKDYGLKIAVHALRGTYLELGMPSGLAPLKALTNSEDDLAFLAQLIRGCIMAGNNKPLTEEEQRRLRMGLETIMELPPENRELWDLRVFLGVGSESAGGRLEKWCRGNELGGIIDNEIDVVDLTSPVIGFDQTKILDNTWARGPVMATLYHYLNKLIDGRRLLFVIDEFWKSLQDDSFRALVNDKLRTLRKQNSPMLLSTQSPKEALDSAISTVIKDQCPTQIYFGNSRADVREYGIKTGIGLTQSEIDIVKALDIGQFLLKQDNISIPAQLYLEGMDEEISVLSTNKTAYLKFTEIEAEGGSQEENVQRFLEARKEAVLW